MGLELINVSKKLNNIDGQITLFSNLSITFPERGMVVIVGESGCGKSTLLNMIDGLDKDYDGKIKFNNQDITYFNNYRQNVISFIYQNYQLIDYLDVKDNCLYYCRLKGIKVSDKEIDKILEDLELLEYKTKIVNELSGGQKQRVAIARAILCNCPLVLCDEPTGALDCENRQIVYKLLKRISKKSLVIVVSHDREVINYANYVVDFDDLKDNYMFNKQLYSRNNLRSYRLGKMYYFMMKMLVNEKKKIFLMFISQIYMVLVITLIISGLNGFRLYFQGEYNNAINRDLVMVQRKDQSYIKDKELKKLKGTYQYHLDIGKVEGIDSFNSFSLNKKMKENEIYVNKKFVETIKSDKVIYSLLDKDYVLKIKGIIDDKYDVPVLYYYPNSLNIEIALGCIDINVCLVYVDDVTKYLNDLPNKYQGICLVKDEYDSYFEIIDLFSKVSVVFVVLSIMIALVLVGYMMLSLFYENQNSYALMLANGYDYKSLNLFMSRCVMSVVLFVGLVSIMCSLIFLKTINTLGVSKKIFGIKEIFILPKIFMNEYLVFVIYLIVYIFLGIILSLYVITKMKKANLVVFLREGS